MVGAASSHVLVSLLTDCSTGSSLFVDPKYVNYGGGKIQGATPFSHLVLKLGGGYWLLYPFFGL